ncbi:MobA/MobL family protein [Neisseria meningitidis]|jgi:hypothetical protein|nr:MobA/MobL family protein [Neisseria meningitidis]
MATAHLSVKVGKAGKGTPHAEYISRTGKYAKKLEQGEKLEATESGNMPAWAEENPLTFWQAADQYERANGTVYREHEIALPRELTAEQRAELVREWVHHELGDRHAYTWAIHNKTALDGKPQPHVHLMYSERMNDGIERDPEQYFRRYNPKYPERGGAKKHRSGETPTERKAALTAQRERWEKLHNAHIDRHLPKTTLLEASRNHRAKISMKSLAEQGIDRQAAAKMTPSESAAMHRKAAADRAAQQAIDSIRAEKEQQARQEEQIQKQRRERAEQVKKASAEAKAREAAERKAAAEKRLVELPTAQLVQEYQQTSTLAGNRKQVEQQLEQGHWYTEQRYRIGQADEAIAKLNKENQNIARAYHAEQERRENSLFGLGAIGAMLKKENTTQQQMQDAYNIRHREKQKLEQGREQMQAEYSEKLEREADKYQEVYRQISAKLAEEITRRPLEAFREPYEQAKQSSTTLAATRSAERIEKELSAKKADPIGQRIAYITGAAELVRAEKIAKPQEERREMKKTQGKGGIER